MDAQNKVSIEMGGKMKHLKYLKLKLCMIIDNLLTYLINLSNKLSSNHLCSIFVVIQI